MRKLKKQKTKEVKTLKPVLRFFYLLLLVGFIFSVFWVYRSGALEKKWNETKTGFHSLMADAGFVVENVLIYGRQRTATEDLNEAVALLPNTPMTEVDINQIKERIELLPWVKSVVIKRQLPNLLEIYLIEKKPLALYQRQGEIHPIDTEGNIIPTHTDGLEYLIVTVGEQAPSFTPELIKTLEKNPEIYEKVTGASFVGNRRWDLILDNNGKQILILLPETEIDTALKRLDRINRQYHLFDRNISQIDLRLDDRLIIETINGKPIVAYPRKESEVSAP